ncbi:15596_t:CDS:1, partial [Entrophospora sp. SA101]
MSSQKHKIRLIAACKLGPTLHYGSFSANWWIFNNRIIPEGEKQTCVPD